MFRNRLVAFYEHYNPSCLDSVDDILEIFRGREEELFRVLQEKYADIPVNSHSRSLHRASNGVRAGGRPAAADIVAQASPHASRSLSAGLNREATPHPPESRNLAELRSFCDDSPRENVPLRSHEKVQLQSIPHLSSSHYRQGNDSEVGVLYEHIKELEKRNYTLRCENVVLQAEKEAMHRQKRDDEETLDILRQYIARHDEIERDLIERVSSSELKEKPVLDKDEFAAIISSSQSRLKDYYEERIAFMQMEMETFYKHAAGRVKEKDEIIAALKDLLAQNEP